MVNAIEAWIVSCFAYHSFTLFGPGGLYGGLRGARAGVLAQARGGRDEPLSDAQAERRCSSGPDRSRQHRGRVRRPRRRGCGTAADGQVDLRQGARRASQEGRQAQHDRAAARLGQLRRDDVDLLEEVRNPHRQPEPERQLGRGEPGHRLAEGRLARSRRGRRRRLVRCRRRSPGSLRQVLRVHLLDDPSRDEGHARASGGATTGAPSRSATTAT